MNEELEPRPAGAAASLDQVRQSVYSDLQYISLQVEGKPYGGWYRILADGRMELLALANMHCERRPEKTPVEQALGMLNDFIHASKVDRDKPLDTPAASGRTMQAGSDESTLGDLLYADKSLQRIPEEDWAELIRRIAAGDAGALDELFIRAHGIIYTLLVRLTGQPDDAEGLTLSVFCDVWHQASRFDAQGGPVLAWLANQARLRATESLEAAHHEPSALEHVRKAATRLSVTERRLIEGAYFSKLSYPELAARPPATMRQRLAERIAAKTGKQAVFSQTRWTEPSWEEAAPGITCQVLATDAKHERVSMLVRLAPGVAYPPHTHAGREELHLLDGDLWIDERRLYPGDYNRAEKGTADKRVWSETGCVCLLITSTQDKLSSTHTD